MKSSDNVVPITPATPAPDALPMPKHLRAKEIAAWKDLIESTDATLHAKQNRFTFEMAATLLAKFRSGKAMTATESKELKKQMIELGLAKDDDDAGQRKRKKNDKYFE